MLKDTFFTRVVKHKFFSVFIMGLLLVSGIGVIVLYMMLSNLFAYHLFTIDLGGAIATATETYNLQYDLRAPATDGKLQGTATIKNARYGKAVYLGGNGKLTFTMTIPEDEEAHVNLITTLPIGTKQSYMFLLDVNSVKISLHTSGDAVNTKIYLKKGSNTITIENPLGARCSESPCIDVGISYISIERIFSLAFPHS